MPPASVARAHAKAILLGEHFVVPWTDEGGTAQPGTSALAIPLHELCTEVRIGPSRSGALECVPGFQGLAPSEDDRARCLMEDVVGRIAPRFGWDRAPVPLRIASSSNFPHSRGFGSSASFSIALARAFQAMSQRPPGAVDLPALALEIENFFHGKSSGLDTSVILAGAPIVYRDGAVQRRFHPRAVDFIVADGGPRENCAAVLARTLELRRAEPGRWARFSARMEELVRACLPAIESERGAGEVAEILLEAQSFLAELGLLTEGLDRVLRAGRELGALAGKISGAGAGGAALLVTAPGEGAAVACRLRDAGFSVLCERPCNAVPLQESLHAQ